MPLNQNQFLKYLKKNFSSKQKILISVSCGIDSTVLYDLINKSQSGLVKSKNILKNIKEIKVIEFDHNDVVRHPLVSKIIRAYQMKSADDQD